MGDSEKLDEERIFRLTSQLPTLHCCQKLYKRCLFYKRQPERMPQVPKKPLGTLCITNCDLPVSLGLPALLPKYL